MLCMLQGILKAEKVSAGHTVVHEAMFADLVTSEVLSAPYITPDIVAEANCLMYQSPLSDDGALESPSRYGISHNRDISSKAYKRRLLS